MKLNLCEKQFKSLKKNNKGMALVTVIVAIGFIAALVSILMLTTLVNFKMKNINERSKDTFYSAEQAIDEINVGLQHVVSDSMSSAYLDIMNNYRTYDVDQKTELLRTKYYESIWDALEVADKGNSVYDVKKLEDFLKVTKWHTPSGESDGYGAIVMAVGESGTESKEGQMITYKESGIVLKNLKVYYKDQMGFVSVVQTDIRLAYPDFDFADTSELPPIHQYAFVADDGAVINGDGKLTLGGNIYANELEITGGTSSSKLVVNTTSNQIITSKYDIILDKNTDFTGKEGDADNDPTTVNAPITIRARDIIVDSSTAKFVGNTYLANDLNIKGRGSDVTLIGDFIGYGMGDNMTDSSADRSWKISSGKPEWSSSILINGKDVQLDMSGLNKLALYGHSYIGTGKVGQYNNRNGNLTYSNDFATTYKGENGTNRNYNEEKKYNDMPMGESVAVKTNQMLYLLPPSAIGVDENGKSLFNKNPLTQAEYETLVKEVNAANSKTVMYSTEVVVPELGTSLDDYVKKDGTLGVQKIWARVNDAGTGSLVYFYISFDDENTANKYYSARYEGSKDKFDNYTVSYLKNIKWPNTDDLILAGNAVDMTNGENGSKKLSRVPSSTVIVTSSDEYKTASLKYLNDFKGMCINLEAKQNDYNNVHFADTYEEEAADATLQSTNQQVYENVMNKNNLKEFVDKVTAGVGDYKNVDMRPEGTGQMGVYNIADSSNEKKVAIMGYSDSLITIDNGTNKDVVLVITEGDVEVKRDFKGLILCNGKVTFDGSHRIEADPEEVRTILKFGFKEDSSEEVYTIAYTLADGSQYVYDSDPGSESANLALGGLITYENWKKD